MMMTNYLIQEWFRWNQLAIDSFKEVASANVQVVDNLLTTFVNPSAFAELAKGSISLSKELNQAYSDNLNELMLVQLKFLNLDVTSEASKNLADIYVNSFTELGKQQMQLVSLVIDTVTGHLKQLEEAKQPVDVLAIQSGLFTELQQNVKNTTLGSLLTVNSLNRALEIWTYRSLDAIIEDAESETRGDSE